MLDLYSTERAVRELDAAGAIAYYASRGRVDAGTITAHDLGGGVSNHVVLVQTAAGERFVLKQALGKLRVKEDWFSDRTRVYREAAAIRRLSQILPEGSVPAILFEDPSEFAFAMSAAPEGALSWKDLLMAGDVSAAVARRIAIMHGEMIRQSWHSGIDAREFGDQAIFDQLRLDPYYRFTAQAHPDLRAPFEEAIRLCREQPVSLVHGDWSPKNFLVLGHEVMAIDFEVIHFGDPAFDSAFLLNHLLLKSMYKPRYREAYATAADTYWHTLVAMVPDADFLEKGTRLHLPLLMLARIDGKSPAEYIREEALRQRVRDFARQLIATPPATINEVFDRLQHEQNRNALRV